LARRRRRRRAVGEGDLSWGKATTRSRHRGGSCSGPIQFGGNAAQDAVPGMLETRQNRAGRRASGQNVGEFQGEPPSRATIHHDLQPANRRRAIKDPSMNGTYQRSSAWSMIRISRSKCDAAGSWAPQLERLTLPAYLYSRDGQGYESVSGYCPMFTTS